MENNKLFSFTRSALLLDFYMPLIKKHAIITAIGVVLCFLMIWTGLNLTSMPKLYATGNFCLGLIFYWAPLIFAYSKDRTLTIGLPASWLEKTLFAVFFCIVLVPIFMLLVWLACDGLVILCGFDSVSAAMSAQSYSQLTGEVGHLLSSGKVMNIVSNGCTVLISLFVVLSVRSNRITWAILTPLITLLAIGILTGFASFFYSLHHTSKFNNPYTIDHEIAMMLRYVFIVSSVVYIILSLIVTFLIFYKGRRMSL